MMNVCNQQFKWCDESVDWKEDLRVDLNNNNAKKLYQIDLNTQ